MAGVPLRDVFPKGLYARSVLLTVLPVTIILALMTLYYYNGHLRSMNTRLSQSVAREVALIDRTCAEQPGNLSAQAFITASLGLRFECDVPPSQELQPLASQFLYRDVVVGAIDERLGRAANVRLDRSIDALVIDIPAADEMRRVFVDRKRAIAINGHIFIVWVVLFSLLMAFTALAFLRNQVRSMLQLTEAAQAFGRGQEMAGFRPSGAREVRAAANAMIEMRNRLIKFTEQRTHMLAGVSHDLRTPLSRLNLHFAMQEQTPDTVAARGDIAEMEAMLEEYLAFAQGDEGERASPTDLTALLNDIVSGFAMRDVRLVQPPDVELIIKPLMMKRAISNLVSNAVIYGDAAEISLICDEDWVKVIVDDNGPGIPPDRFEEAFKPFARLNDARTQNLPGTGLGLALARDAAQRSGGQVTLYPSPLGGLRAEMQLPR
ncbi:MAG: ATP-binding protein [Pseudomonadota bacterium]